MAATADASKGDLYQNDRMSKEESFPDIIYTFRRVQGNTDGLLALPNLFKHHIPHFCL
jgi:hypothetical protein